MNLRTAPRPKGIVLRLMVLVTAATLAVFLQAGAGASQGTGQPEPVERSVPDRAGEATGACGAPAEPAAALNHPALLAAAQPSAASSSLASSDCSRDASAGS
ncbi:hypothetical protein [Arenimonas caeni]|jgi:hypothetical protein|uniref:Secreted protein n=1 Tax=Arenimonas caeni TaxID=2058085 RepID=A0A2P6MCK3_9GAMM|nr:hypothetical protein [Arenimonas caeni]PRH83706.1 hypothetical protein C6N40_00750 [Arenimonas caeni]